MDEEKMEKRVSDLETWQGKTNTRLAIVENNVENVQKKLDKIDNNTTWLLRIVIGSLISAGLWYLISTPANMPGILKFIGGFIHE
ncbi:hemolysin XhlA family protein [Tuberibacillus sp. Marseille-P3662]|uniref:hemolysin XhlA family protein n=1 Tax=Tuberibacillus sp. Marseille-P3662 TaxID=1965358 RepID=UPI000A1C9B94|nr:hemolysin XhlA family protein [Tuberibacillus sp. Marseille-P3662]